MTREEAIEVYNGLINTKIKEAFEFFAPELRESEDAMMEKAIVDALLSHCNSINLLSARGYQIEDVKAWLEKQKEQKPLPGFDDLTPDEKMNHPLYLEGSDVGREVGRVEAEQKPAERNKATINGEPVPTENHSVDIPLAEWSEEDEDFINMLILHFNYLIDKGGDSVETYKSYIEKLKSLLPPPPSEIYQAAKHDLAIKFMNYLDENRPEGKMSLSNGECEDIDKAFKENDWAKIMRYVEKYRPRWKTIEEQMEALGYAISGDFDKIKPTSYLSRRLEEIEKQLKKLM